MKRILSGVMLSLLLASVMTSAIVVQPVKSDPTPTISLDPPTRTVRPETNFTVNLNIADVTDLAAWSVVLEWDPSLLELVGATKGSFCEEWSWYDDINRSEGAYLLLSNDPMVGAGALSGSGTLAELEFHAITQGQCALTLTATSLINASSNLIPAPPYLGDANGDMRVNPVDLAAVLHAWDSYNASADFNSDGKINAYDVWCVVLNWMINYNTFPQTYQPVEIPHQVYNGTVQVEAIHDVSITDVTPYKTVIEQGVADPINVTVENQGDYAETFNVTTYYMDVTIITPEQWQIFWSMGDVNRDGYINQTDEDIIAANYGWIGPPGGNPADINSDGIVNVLDAIVCANDQGLDIWTHFNLSGVIGKQEIVDLPPGSSTTLTFTWDTTSVAKGNYTIKAIADTVPGETDTADNECTDGWVFVSIFCDVNGDRSCDMADISMMIDGFMAQPGADGKFWHYILCPFCPHSPNCDVNDDLSIDMLDIDLAIDNFMKSDC